MSWELIGALVWEVANSPLGIAVVASGAFYLLNKLYAAKPAWQAYEGSIIRAVQWAEREIPDDTANKHLRRADLALQYVLKAYARMNGHEASRRMREELAQGIEVVHSDLECAGVL